MNQKIQIGILGYADIAKRYLIPAITELDDLYEIKAIASKSQDKPKHGLLEVAWHKDYYKIISNDDIDLVYIPLPNALHFKWVKESLTNGKHVICEKSLGCSLTEVMELSELALKNNLLLFENFQFRFHKQYEKLIELLKQKKIGELRCLRASFGFPPFSDSNNIRYNKILGGGALLDAGAYTVKISQLLLGQELSVKASRLFVDNDRKIDIWGGAFLVNNSGMFSEVAFGFDNFYQCGIELWGSTGKISTNRLFTSPPGHNPEIFLETKLGTEKIVIEGCNHFKNMLTYVESLINNQSHLGINYEHELNIDQSRIIEEIRNKSNL